MTGTSVDMSPEMHAMHLDADAESQRRGRKRRRSRADVANRATLLRGRRSPTIAIVGIVQATGVLTFDFGDETLTRRTRHR